MHIALFISCLQMGGSERVMTNLAHYLHENGHRVTLVTQYKAQREYELNPEIDRIYSEITDEETDSRIHNFIARYSKLRNIWKEVKPDVILSFIGKNNVMAIATSRGLNIPIAVSVRGEPHEEYIDRGTRIAAKMLFPLADKVVLQTSDSAKFFSRRIQRKSIIMPNGLNPAFIKPVFEGERKKEIVSVGRIDANKNHMLLIEAFEELLKEKPETFGEYKVIIYGDGELRPKLLDYVKNHGLENNVFLPGLVKHVEDVIDKSEIFVLTSNTEGLPNTLLEAMSLGLVSISTDCPCGGPRDIIEHKKNGFLILVGDKMDLKENLQEIAPNSQLKQEICKNAVKIREKYNPELIHKKWEDFLVKMVKA